MHLTEKDALHNILLNKAQAQHGVYTNSPSHEMASDSFQYRDQNYDGGFYERSEDIKSNVCTDAQGLVQATKCQQQRALAEELCLRTADDYKAEILRHMRYVESRTMPDFIYVNARHDTYWAMRFILIEFLVQIHAKFELPPEALFLSVNLLDRYCCCKGIGRSNYQLLGCTTLWIAAKYGDSKKRLIPSLAELCSACCNLYDRSNFVEMEWDVLQVLGWAIGHPDTHTFLKVALADSFCNRQVGHVSMYITETALFFKEFACTKPSILSEAALALAAYMLGRISMNASPGARDYDPHTFVNLFTRLYRPPPVLFTKYASKQFSHASKVVAGCLQPWT